MINVSTVVPDFRRLAKEAPPMPARMWKLRAHVVIGIRENNLGNTHMINVDNASAMEQEKENDWYSGSIAKLKHTATASKPCVNLVTVSKGYPCAIFLDTVLKI
jgi:stalled ribosome rescue protein Dom34